MLNRLKTLSVLLGLCASSLVLAESTLVFENLDAEGSKSQQTIAISGPWMRSEIDLQTKPDYSLMDSARMMWFDVDDTDKSFRVTRLGHLFWPDAPPPPTFKPTKKRQSIAGVPCIVVQEMGKEGPVAEHCMAAIGPLGLNRRELIVMSRLYMSGRRMQTGEIGVATPDERQIAIQSKSLVDKRSRILKSVSHQPTPDEKLKVPDVYRWIKPDLPRAPIKDPEDYRKMLKERAAEKEKALEAEKEKVPEAESGKD